MGTLSQLSDLTTNIGAIRIPNSLAETSFRDLQLTAFFLDMIDVLGLSILVNGSTPSDAIIGGETVNAIINAGDGDMDQNGYADSTINYHGIPTTRILEKPGKRSLVDLFGFSEIEKRRELFCWSITVSMVMALIWSLAMLTPALKNQIPARHLMFNLIISLNLEIKNFLQ